MNDTKHPPIVINHMFSGNYLEDNIGHEIINLFKDDEGVNYIYLCKDGKYNRNKLPKYVIQVRRYGTRTLEVINIAEIDDNNIEKIDIDKIKYGGCKITSLFEGNIGQEINTFITFKAKRVVKPNIDNPVYISYWGNRLKDRTIIGKETPYPSILPSQPILLDQETDEKKSLFDVSEALRNIIEYDDTEDSDYQKLAKLIESAFNKRSQNAATWIISDENDKINNVSNTEEYEDTVGDIYKINNLELPYSNAFKYFIEQDPLLLKGFCNHLVEKEKFNHNNKLGELGKLCKYLNEHDYKLTIRREWENIDIIIEIDNKWVIVIENKIFSDLNGKAANEITQLDKYYKIVVSGKKTSKDKNGDEKEVDVKNIPAHYSGCNKIFILLTPDHNNINISQYQNWYKIHYSLIYDFLANGVEDKSIHLKEFEQMIKQHSVKDYNYGVMKRRFERALIKAKNSKQQQTVDS